MDDLTPWLPLERAIHAVEVIHGSIGKPAAYPHPAAADRCPPDHPAAQSFATERPMLAEAKMLHRPGRMSPLFVATTIRLAIFARVAIVPDARMARMAFARLDRH